MKRDRPNVRHSKNYQLMGMYMKQNKVDRYMRKMLKQTRLKMFHILNETATRVADVGTHCVWEQTSSG